MQLYCNQKIRIDCNGSKSKIFSATNGVKQGGVLSPRLFNIYLNDLLIHLKSLGIGCHMNGQFVGTFIYADDITILAPTQSCLANMLHTCDRYASHHDLLFNPDKTKCMFFTLNNRLSHFPLNFKNVNLEFVKQCHLLGVYISTDILYRNIQSTIHTFYRKCNEVRLDFAMVSSEIKAKLISIYCMDLYGSQMWNFSDDNVQSFYTAWRRVTRIVWNLPNRAHCNLLHTINDTMPIDCIVEKRCLKCIHSCINSDNTIVKNIALSSLDNCYSVIGQNYRYLSVKYNISHKKWLKPLSELLACFYHYIGNEVINLDNAYMVRELTICRDNNSPFLLTNTEMSQFIEYICTI